MALHGPIPVTFAHLFPHGCYLVGEVEPVKDFDASTRERFVQSRDKHTGEPVWQVAVMDADPTLKAARKTVSVKILAAEQPVLPPAVAGLPFTPVEFDDITVTPYVHSGTNRLAYSIRVRAVHAPRATATGTAPATTTGKVAAAGKDAA
ncbi:plasmid replication, integration and excision activator [Spongiactinospora sp. TRM90649]|uniref:plasmid replication, integration and excision activator n=1 Tax=Spongiactinospora sp. TRM90649 TaxID=3031114 RepID=UPI0023F66951|nr:plasmid replication, integration and excision activator [Spongiactinospora sp. TRM90649]MDF5756182.1 plasmid replication, integration and excision activator [Spongiactinospora sp. TRM90649]